MKLFWRLSWERIRCVWFVRGIKEDVPVDADRKLVAGWHLDRRLHVHVPPGDHGSRLAEFLPGRRACYAGRARICQGALRVPLREAEGRLKCTC